MRAIFSSVLVFGDTLNILSQFLTILLTVVQEFLVLQDVTNDKNVVDRGIDTLCGSGEHSKR